MKNNTKINILLCAIIALISICHLNAMDKPDGIWVQVVRRGFGITHRLIPIYKIFIPEQAIDQMSLFDEKLMVDTTGQWILSTTLSKESFSILIHWLVMLNNKPNQLAYILRQIPADNLLRIRHFAEWIGASDLLIFIDRELTAQAFAIPIRPGE